MTLDFGNGFDITQANVSIKKDLSNLPDNSKEQITNYSYPDISQDPETLETLDSGGTYTATDTGYVVIKCLSSATGQYAGVYKKGIVFAGGSSSTTGGYDMHNFPVIKGEQFSVGYSGYPKANITIYFWKSNGYK